MSDLATAYLPGVGFLVDPQPADYRRAIRFLEHRLSYLPMPPSTRRHCAALMATERRLAWAPRRLRKRAAA